jgi:hypothetical protein
MPPQLRTFHSGCTTSSSCTALSCKQRRHQPHCVRWVVVLVVQLLKMQQARHICTELPQQLQHWLAAVHLAAHISRSCLLCYTARTLHRLHLLDTVLLRRKQVLLMHMHQQLSYAAELHHTAAAGVLTCSCLGTAVALRAAASASCLACLSL